MNRLTPEQAFNNLSVSTEPANIAKLTRQDFVNINESLIVLAEALKELAEFKKPHPDRPLLDLKNLPA